MAASGHLRKEQKRLCRSGSYAYIKQSSDIAGNKEGQKVTLLFKTLHKYKSEYGIYWDERDKNVPFLKLRHTGVIYD